MANLKLLVAMAITIATTVSSQATYSTSVVVYPSTTMNQFAVSLSADGTCGAFYSYVTPDGATSIYAFRPETGTILVSGTQQFCGAPRMSADGKCIVYWAESGTVPNQTMKPVIAIWSPGGQTWIRYGVPTTSTTIPYHPHTTGKLPPAVTNYPDVDHPPIIIFRDPAVRVAEEGEVVYQRMKKWTFGQVDSIYVTHPYRDCDAIWINSNPWTDPLGTVITYVGYSGGYREIYRYATSLNGGSSDTCISRNSSSGVAANGDCDLPQSSGDSRYVVFQSKASNLDGTNPRAYYNVFVCDTLSGTYGSTSRAYDYTNQDLNSQGGNCTWPTISYDGNWVAFQSTAKGLISGLTYPLTWTGGVYLIPRGVRSLIEYVPFSLLGEVKVGYRPSLANNATIGFDSSSTGIAIGDDTNTEKVFIKSGHN